MRERDLVVVCCIHGVLPGNLTPLAHLWDPVQQRAEPAEVEAAAAEAAGPEVEAEVVEAEVTVAEGAVAEAGFN